MPDFNLELLAVALVLCLSIKPQRSPRSVWQGMFCEPLTTDDTANTPELWPHTAVDAETFAHSFLVLFFVALRHLHQMLLAMGMTNIRLFSTACRCAKAGGFPLLVLTLVLLDLLGSTNLTTRLTDEFPSVGHPNSATHAKRPSPNDHRGTRKRGEGESASFARNPKGFPSLAQISWLSGRLRPPCLMVRQPSLQKSVEHYSHLQGLDMTKSAPNSRLCGNRG